MTNVIPTPTLRTACMFLAVCMWLITARDAFSQSPVYGMEVPGIDQISRDKPILHMWVGYCNNVIPSNNACRQILDIQVSNGKAFTENAFAYDYCITPEKKGKVVVSTTQVVRVGADLDTIQTKTSFRALDMPAVRLEVTKDPVDSGYHLLFVDAHTGKQMPRRYTLAGMFDPEILDPQGNVVEDGIWGLGYTEILEHDVIREVPFSTGFAIRGVAALYDRKTGLVFGTLPFHIVLP